MSFRPDDKNKFFPQYEDPTESEAEELPVKVSKPRAPRKRKTPAIDEKFFAPSDIIPAVKGSRASAAVGPAYLPQQTKIPTTKRRRQAGDPAEPVSSSGSTVAGNRITARQIQALAKRHAQAKYDEVMSYYYNN